MTSPARSSLATCKLISPTPDDAPRTSTDWPARSCPRVAIATCVFAGRSSGRRRSRSRSPRPGSERAPPVGDRVLGEAADPRAHDAIAGAKRGDLGARHDDVARPLEAEPVPMPPCAPCDRPSTSSRSARLSELARTLTRISRRPRARPVDVGERRAAVGEDRRPHRCRLRRDRASATASRSSCTAARRRSCPSRGRIRRSPPFGCGMSGRSAGTSCRSRAAARDACPQPELDQHRVAVGGDRDDLVLQVGEGRRATRRSSRAPPVSPS